MTNPTRRQSDVEDERRLLGDHRNPKGAIPIAVPGAEFQTPAVKRSVKPGSGGAFRPTNTLGHNNFQGGAGATGSTVYPKAGGKAKHPNALATETSRGSNVHYNQPDFPDERQVKRPRTHYMQQTNGRAPNKTVELFSSLLEEEERESAKPQQTPARKKPQVQRLPPWQVSGPQESRRVDDIVSRTPPGKRANSLQGQSQQANGEKPAVNKRIPSPRHQQVHEISDDDDEPVRVSRLAEERPAKRLKSIDDEQVEIQRTRRNKRTDIVSEWFRPRASSNSAEPTSVDAEKAPVHSALKAGMMDILGPSSSSKQAGHGNVDKDVDELDTDARTSSPPRRRSHAKIETSSAIATDGIADDEDELHGSGDIQPSFKNGMSLGNRAMDTKSKQRSKGKHRSKKVWQVDRLVNPEGRLFEGFKFLDLRIVIGETSKHLTLEEPDSFADEKLLVVDGKWFRGLLTSEDPENRIVRLRGVGNPEPWHDILFHDHEQAMDFVAAFDYLSTVRQSEIRCDRTK
jgi:hypothetical protein